MYRTFKLSEVENLASARLDSRKIPRTEFLPLVRSIVVMKHVFQESTRHARRPLSTSAFVVSTACNIKGRSQKCASAECKELQLSVVCQPLFVRSCFERRLGALQRLCQYFTSVDLIRTLPGASHRS